MVPYLFDGAAVFYGHIPQTVTVSNQGIVAGKLGDASAKSSAWPEPPHVALAKTSLGAKAVSAFTKRYGPITTPTSVFASGVRRPGVEGRRPVDGALPFTPGNLLSLGADSAAISETFSFSLNDFAEKRDRIQLAWRGDRLALEVLRQAVRVTNFHVALYGDGGGGVVVRSRVLWDFICLVFLIDHDTGKAKVCANSKCVTPYFLQGRTDNNFCSHGCAVAANNARRAQQKQNERTK